MDPAPVQSLRLKWKYCLDGVVLASETQRNYAGVFMNPPDLTEFVTREVYRYRSANMTERVYEAADLTDPIVLKFINARTTAQRVAFLSKFGIPGGWPAPAGRHPTKYRDDDFEWGRKRLLLLLGMINYRSPVLLAEQVNEALASHVFLSPPHDPAAEEMPPEDDEVLPALGPVRLTPTMVCLPGGQTPRLMLEPDNFFDYLVLEVAAAAENDARLAACHHCGKFFLTGPHTGRRSSAQFCEDKCRVAAMRKRRASEAAE